MILHKFYYSVNKWWTSWRAAYKFLVDEDKYSWESSHKICRTIWKEFRNFYSEFSFVNRVLRFLNMSSVWKVLSSYCHIYWSAFLSRSNSESDLFSGWLILKRREEKRSKSSRDWGEKDFKKICNKVSTPVPGSIVLWALLSFNFDYFFNSCISCNNPTVD